VELGKPAPELKIGTWIKNGPATLAEGKGKKIYIIEFWNTSSKECVKIMPFLHKLQQQYQDVVIISISPQKADIVKNFVARYKNISYKIAVDDNNKTCKAYMHGKQKIPVAFIINRSGTVAWVGHPLDMSLPLKRMISGKFDIKKSAHRQEIYKEMKTLVSVKKYAEALKILEKELKNEPGNTQFTALKAFVLFKLNKKDEALKFVGEMLKKHPTDMDLFELKAYMLGQVKKYKELDEFYFEFINNCKDKPVLLNQLTRQLLGVRFGEAKLEPALRAAELAYSNRKLDKLQRANIGETLARIYYMIGRIDRAITIQKIVCRIFKKHKNAKYVYALRILEYYQRAYNLGQGQKLVELRTSNIERPTSNEKNTK
jgi:tetratricopeptide (TPR) repeat protein